MTEIIAELGSNPVDYGWDTDLFCESASRAGATHVKIQVYRAEHFPPAYQDAKRRLEFPRERIREFAANANRFGLKAGASVFDDGAVQICALELDFLKLAAREQYNFELMKSIRRVHGPYPFYRSISDWNSLLDNGIGYSTNEWIPLYAIQEYPAPMAKSIIRLLIAARKFPSSGLWEWGWSSHTTGILDCLLAARMGASVIEKHFALSPGDEEAGHSLSPYKFGEMCMRINS